MNQYEVNFIIDPVLSGDEIKSTAGMYESLLKDQGCSIVHVNEMGLKQLAYSINKKSSGFYYCIEFTTPVGSVISKVELALRRDERIMRFLTVKLDKYGVQYNEDRRSGKISSYKKKESKKKPFDGGAASTTETVQPQAQTPPVPQPVVSNEEE
ncbi:MAG TPA: 30S ribosomal protein S6 [Saprospiraceae bacterium]|nr:30S ribosomal protein S6 [Saprospiraceae bacterium]HRO07388.1 30S ribosomal protein S6 [Saprospiraceae bacterium]HRO72164.1 30S ribosomal protein S6 [Saprospiraceae bacterium]HRP40671.1 30S ribosomal protein S6 [Saprospiraceae bacterium]